MKFYWIFKQKLKLTAPEKEYFEETKINSLKESKREELGLFLGTRKFDFARQNQSIVSFASSSELAVVAGPINGQVDKKRAEVLNNLLSMYASLIFNYVFEPISSLSPLNSFQWSSTLIIDAKQKVVECTSHFDEKSIINPK